MENGNSSLEPTPCSNLRIECNRIVTEQIYPWELKLGYGEKELAVGADDNREV